jgi:FKBP-type peptidyl-prolyl cis-trans isomerase FkpA
VSRASRGWEIERYNQAVQTTGALVNVIKSRRRTAVLFSLLVAVAASGCTELPTEASGSAPFSQTDLRAGAGAAAANSNVISVNYTGWLYDVSQPGQKGLQFDTSAGRGPLEFTLGVGDVIAGWDLGLVGLRQGGVRRLVIPPSLAYGAVRNGPIPPNATLVFEVELLEVKTENGQ